jgi:hypothetical protein
MIAEWAFSFCSTICVLWRRRQTHRKMNHQPTRLPVLGSMHGQLFSGTPLAGQIAGTAGQVVVGLIGLGVVLPPGNWVLPPGNWVLPPGNGGNCVLPPGNWVLPPGN